MAGDRDSQQELLRKARSDMEAAKAVRDAAKQKLSASKNSSSAYAANLAAYNRAEKKFKEARSTVNELDSKLKNVVETATAAVDDRLELESRFIQTTEAGIETRQQRANSASNVLDKNPNSASAYAEFQRATQVLNDYISKHGVRLGRARNFVENNTSTSGSSPTSTTPTPVAVTPPQVSGQPPIVINNPTTSTTVTPTGSTVPLGQGRDQKDFATPVKPTTTTPPPLTGTSNTNRVLRSAVDEALKDQGLADTPANRKKIRAEIAAKGGVQDNSWEAVFKANEPGYAWMFTDEMKTKYPDVFELFKKASAPGYDRDLFQRQFTGTSWYTTLAAGQTGRELTANVGSFNWGAGNLAKFLTNATHMGWTGENLKAEAYKELFKKGGDGKYVNDLAIKEVQASTPYLKLKKIGTSFFSPMSDERIIESLTGGVSTDDVLRLARERAKIIYPHLASAIDAGLTLDDISYDYKRIAAETLELSPDAVDMSSSKFNRAMKSGEGGKERMLSTGEWETLIRTDPNYGYQFTKTANQDATDLGLSLARAFGKTG